ncbi:MAG: hypothetical protein J7496_05020 [Novosphingobium sp.]|nr:hypothetical protein [Novosphingobium sp.]
MFVDTGAIGEQLHSVFPVRIIWQSDHAVINSQWLTNQRISQPLQSDSRPACVLEPGGALLIDFGCELNGSVELAVGAPVAQIDPLPALRLRLGESASEAMAELGERNAGNDYAVRDDTVMMPWLGVRSFGPSGFRFLRIDCAGQIPVPLTHVRAVLALRNVEPSGSFRCSDQEVTRIWEVGAWTTRLNLQHHLWDGIKRDRLVWLGDLQPAAGAVQAIFGPDPAIERSLDLIRDCTPIGSWMNGISSYSLWWILIHERWWWGKGDRAYLEEQRTYLAGLTALLLNAMDASGREQLGGMRFIDWPSAGVDATVSAGLQALLCLALGAGSRMLSILGDAPRAEQCAAGAARARRAGQAPSASKAIAGLQALAGMIPSDPAALRILEGGARGMTAFLGGFALETLARAGRVDRGLAIMRGYWGAMIERGATSFWEEFDVDWLEGSGRIDELPDPGQRDLHGDFGRFGHAGFRMSLCHAWSVAPTAWLSENVLGIRPASPGLASVSITPQLGMLDWAEGRYPTPHGLIWVRHERKNGTIESEISLPDGVGRAADGAGTKVL